MNITVNTMDKMWEKLNTDSISYEQSMNKLHRKQTGCYFTALDLTYVMMKELVDSFPHYEQRFLFEKTFFEPCVGTGNFVYAYLRVCKEKLFSYEQYKELLNNIYVCDINVNSLEIYRQNLTLLAQEWFGVTLTSEYFDTHIGSGLLFDVDSSDIRYIPLEEVFDSCIIKDGFDIVVTNPPYKNLKAERAHYQSDDQKTQDKQKYIAIAKLANEHFTYSTSGTLNLYKLFVEEIIERYLSQTGMCSLLIPSSILSDKSCAKLRTRILNRMDVQSLRLISENSSYVDASQALCAMLMRKGQPTKKILVDGAFSGDIRQGASALIEDIIDTSTGNAILVLSENEYRIHNLMRKHPTIKEIPYIINLRGELDITINKAAIVCTETPYRLLRGRHIGYYSTVDLPKKEYATEQFVQSTAKQKYIKNNRLVCQQIVNMAKKRRIAFTLIPRNYVLANSCNFVSVENNQDGIDIFFLMGILNSELIDWYFKLTSSNNHINNYEIDNFPIPVSYPGKAKLSQLVQQYLQDKNENLLMRINALVNEAFGVSEMQEDLKAVSNDTGKYTEIAVFDDQKGLIHAFLRDLQQIIPSVSIKECDTILRGHASVKDLYLEKKPDSTKFEVRVLENLEMKYRRLFKGYILNHTTFNLSNLDLEMIATIPQGGNWKDIPNETVKKSKRLSRITQTGGRTTLYGRIDYSKPSYTITTYFNRPGNGTYVHPIHDRVISVREAARFQCFPDDYLFCGNKSDMLKQVGNAVPVLLAYALGKRIREKTGCQTSVDLFSGAGGMTYGFKRAGINAVIANDFAESACITLKTNCPEIPVLCGDVTEENTKKAIIDAGVASGADIICGGPPCQGFSLAGFRMKDDPRNQLFRHFIDIVSGVDPKVIVFENVEGLLSFQGGETYRSIIELFSELGYHTEAQKLFSNHYGVPQRRKRVIILCTRKDIGVKPAELFPKPVTPNDDYQVTAYDTIYDLEQVVCSENARYTSSYTSPFIQYLKHQMSIDDYLKAVTDVRGTICTEALDAKNNHADAEEKIGSMQLSLF